MDSEKEKFLLKLRQIEGHARALTGELAADARPAGLPLHRARLIQATAAHLALRVELEDAGGHLLDAANDAARSHACPTAREKS